MSPNPEFSEQSQFTVRVTHQENLGLDLNAMLGVAPGVAPGAESAPPSADSAPNQENDTDE